MPNIRSQSVGPRGIVIVASDGREITITPDEILRTFNDQPDGLPRGVNPARDLGQNIADAKQRARERLAQMVEDALGAEQIAASSLTIDFSEFDGRGVALEIRS